MDTWLAFSRKDSTKLEEQFLKGLSSLLLLFPPRKSCVVRNCLSVRHSEDCCFAATVICGQQESGFHMEGGGVFCQPQ